jgi:hypothetical protein
VAPTGGPDDDNMYENRQWCDLLFVPSDCDGKGSRALFLKQLSSVGAPSWTDGDHTLLLPSRPDGADVVAADIAAIGVDLVAEHIADVRGRGPHIRVVIFTTDKGGDQQGSHKLLQGPIVSLTLTDAQR